MLLSDRVGHLLLFVRRFERCLKDLAGDMGCRLGGGGELEGPGGGRRGSSTVATATSLVSFLKLNETCIMA